MNSGARSHMSRNFSGCSVASVTRPTVMATTPAGRRPVASKNPPAPSDPKISARFQFGIISSGQRSSCLKLEQGPSISVASLQMSFRAQRGIPTATDNAKGRDPSPRAVQVAELLLLQHAGAFHRQRAVFHFALYLDVMAFMALQGFRIGYRKN